MRRLVRETEISAKDFVQPFFVLDGKNKKEPVEAMPGIYRFSIDNLLRELESYQRLGGFAGLFFGVSSKKDFKASYAYTQDGLIQKAIKSIKKNFPEFLVMTDVCLCGYTSHGHCGIIKNGNVDNDETLPVLSKMALSHAQAGADIVAPSDMMDFRVGHIRRHLDDSGFKDVSILSYAVKYASSFYGPFRDAAHSSPKFGDRKTYQMDPTNKREALKEAKQDVVEGADIVMVKPALPYLDVISLLREKLDVPIAAYSVSGEYSMIKAAAQKKWIDERDVVLESSIAIKRAGADIIISYYAQDVLTWMSKGR